LALNANLVVTPSARLREVLETVTKGSRQAVAVVDVVGRLVGLVTDGDIRRAILRGVALDAPVAEIMNRAPITASPAIRRSEALVLMRERAIRHLPLVGADGVLADFLLLEDLLEPPPLPNPAVLMAGGAGSRLRPLTEATPKPLLRVGGKPLLEILVERLRATGVREFFVTVNYKSDMIEDYFGDGSRLGVRIRYVREPEPLGTAGSLRLIEGLSAIPFLLVNGDILTKCDFRALLAFHERHAADVTVGTVPYEVDLPYGILEVDGDRVAALAEKPRLDFLINSGIYVIDPSVIALIPPARVFDVPDLVRALVAAGRRVIGFPIREYWLDVGRHDDLMKAHRDVAEGLLD
jgi:dTDP-glucose pyrophosphorylase